MRRIGWRKAFHPPAAKSHIYIYIYICGAYPGAYRFFNCKFAWILLLPDWKLQAAAASQGTVRRIGGHENLGKTLPSKKAWRIPGAYPEMSSKRPWAGFH